MSAFIDKAKIHIQSGSGGNGMVAWRREKFVPQGGPAGGDGGRGGSVIIEATEDLNTLLEFKHKAIFKADDGEKGQSKNMHGKSGKDLIVYVPCGTIVRDAETGKAIADLQIAGDQVMVATGGRGGRGNSRFLSSKRKAPQFSEPGEPGIERELDLELKLLADVGIIGLPNAGKSTLISVISAAKPKIANYPFTTLVPNLGVVRKPDGNAIVVADIPGLVEGASQGIGLGHEFLRHVERTRLLLHLVDISGAAYEAEGDEDSDNNQLYADPIKNYMLINQELKKYSPKLSDKPQIIVLSKTDTLTEEQVQAWRDKFTGEFYKEKVLADRPILPLFTISAVTKNGVDELLKTVFETLEQLPPDDSVVDVVPDDKAFNNDDSAFDVHRKGHTFYVTGGKIQRLFDITDLRNKPAVFRLMNILKAMGVNKALSKAGAKEGDTISIAGVDFDYTPDDTEKPLDTV